MNDTYGMQTENSTKAYFQILKFDQIIDFNDYLIIRKKLLKLCEIEIHYIT